MAECVLAECVCPPVEIPPEAFQPADIYIEQPQDIQIEVPIEFPQAEQQAFVQQFEPQQPAVRPQATRPNPALASAIANQHGGVPGYQVPVYQSPLPGAAVKLPFIPGHQAPKAPPGHMYVYMEQISPAAVILAILLFPLGLLFLLILKDRFWLLQAIPQHAMARR